MGSFFTALFAFCKKIIGHQENPMIWTGSPVGLQHRHMNRCCVKSKFSEQNHGMHSGPAGGRPRARRVVGILCEVMKINRGNPRQNQNQSSRSKVLTVLQYARLHLPSRKHICQKHQNTSESLISLARSFMSWEGFMFSGSSSSCSKRAWKD